MLEPLTQGHSSSKKNGDLKLPLRYEHAGSLLRQSPRAGNGCHAHFVEETEVVVVFCW